MFERVSGPIFNALNGKFYTFSYLKCLFKKIEIIKDIYFIL